MVAPDRLDHFTQRLHLASNNRRRRHGQCKKNSPRRIGLLYHLSGSIYLAKGQRQFLKIYSSALSDEIDIDCVRITPEELAPYREKQANNKGNSIN